MEKFLYLTKKAWAVTWINGGEIPIYLASKYKNDERLKTMTPDETIIHDSEIDTQSLNKYGIIFKEGKKNTFIDCISHGHRMPDIINASYYYEDGLILSFCNTFSQDIAKKLGKKICVKILSIEKLKIIIDKQLGCKGIMKSCEYTMDHQRNHFLKSVEDKWQNEFRIFWRVSNSRWVKIPKGLAEFVAEF